MSAPAAFLRASRPVAHATNFHAQARAAFARTTPFRAATLTLRQTALQGRRFQSTTTTTTTTAAAPAAQQQQKQQQQQGGQQQQGQQQQGGQQESWFKRMWESPIGFRTVHFWAPVMKWAIVLAGIADFARPAEKLSLTQNASLTATGLIWTRWCFVITPKNYLLAAVNFFLALVGTTQVTRIMMYRAAHPEAAEGQLTSAPANPETVGQQAAVVAAGAAGVNGQKEGVKA